MSHEELTERANELKNVALAELRFAVKEDFNFSIEHMFTFVDEDDNFVSMLASRGFKREGKVYLYGYEFGSDTGLPEVADDSLPLEEIIKLLKAYQDRNEPSWLDKLNVPEIEDDLASLMEAILPDGEDYFVKLAADGEEKVFGPFNRQSRPRAKWSDIRKVQFSFRTASETAWREIKQP